jgi:hypothetical protein
VHSFGLPSINKLEHVILPIQFQFPCFLAWVHHDLPIDNLKNASVLYINQTNSPGAAASKEPTVFATISSPVEMDISSQANGHIVTISWQIDLIIVVTGFFSTCSTLNYGNSGPNYHLESFRLYHWKNQSLPSFDAIYLKLIFLVVYISKGQLFWWYGSNFAQKKRIQGRCVMFNVLATESPKQLQIVNVYMCNKWAF